MKQTEIGLIPDDWEVKNFKEVTNRITVGIANSATHAYTDHGIIMFRNQNIKENTLDLKDLIYIKKDFAQRYSNKQLYENDLLIARTGYPGTTCVVPKEFEGCQTFTTLIATPKSDVINSDYIAYYFNSDFGKKLFSAAQIGGAQKNVNAHTLSNIKICIPPLSEQQRIAKALSDVDSLIFTTEKLLQKKKNIRQGAMQELLTGKKRLPGFGPQTKTLTYKQTELGPIPEDWEVKSLGEMLKIGHGKDYKNLKSGNVPVYGTGGYMTSVNDFLYEGETVCIGRKGTIDKPQYHSGKIWTVDTLFYTYDFKSLNPKYLFYKFCLIDWLSMNEASGVPSLTAKNIEDIQIAIPTEEEQTAIANVLSSMDKEIETLNTKLEKYRNLKTAMMQQLLTGKIRLVK
ncbi:MAG: restriction endonuclease subunit S [Treponema sp.]|nr:restriction endonuclease subunit S [Treponema sp.]